MGGYRAFKLALSYPERYAAAASLSGAVDIAGARKCIKYTKTNNENVISDAKLILEVFKCRRE